MVIFHCYVSLPEGNIAIENGPFFREISHE